MKEETGGAAIEEFVQLKTKMYSFFVDDRIEHKKAKTANKNVVAAISYGEYKDVLLNHKYLTHSMKRIQSKSHKIGTNEINKISLSWFDYEIYLLNNGHDRLTVSC